MLKLVLCFVGNDKARGLCIHNADSPKGQFNTSLHGYVSIFTASLRSNADHKEKHYSHLNTRACTLDVYNVSLTIECFKAFIVQYTAG